MFTNLQFADFAKKRFEAGDRYWYGTYGQLATQALLNSKAAQYPSHYGSDRMSTYKQHIAKGLTVADCVGLIKSFFWTDNGALSAPKYASNGFPDTNADGAFKLCSETGTIKSLPDIPGLVLWCSGHIGVYIGGGYAIEERGFVHGNVKTKVSDRSWTHWGKLPMLDYVVDGAANTETPLLTKGDKGIAVVKMQTLLLAHGEKLPKYGADGDFGDETRTALVKFQCKHNLSGTGVCGADTWAALLGDVSATNNYEEVSEDNPDIGLDESPPVKEPANPYKAPTKNIAKGAKGEKVRWVQWALINAGYSCGASGIDGDFGAKTHASVLSYQCAKKLVVDGIVGQKTRAALKEDGGSGTGSTSTAPTAPTSKTMIVDLSQHNDLTNPKNDWAKIAQNVGLLILRCGVTRTETVPKGIEIDDHFAYAAQKCYEHGIPFGVYYYGKVSTEVEGRKEADKAWDTASQYSPLFYCYDAEEGCLTDACIKAWADQIRKRGAKKVGMYIGHNYYTKHKATVSAFDFIWIPRYGKNTGDYDPQYAPAYPCDLHQYTSVGNLPGINDNTVDLNRLTGTKTLEWFLRK